MIYTGVGSRKTPEPYMYLMSIIAVALGPDATLRSGAAKGADTAFEQGAYSKEIYLPWKGFNDSESELYLDILPERKIAEEVAESLHPAWKSCSDVAKKLHTRNVYQVLGRNLDHASDMLVCWTPDGANGKSINTTRHTGGTATAIRLAVANDVPVFNMLNDKDIKVLMDVVGKDEVQKVYEGIRGIIPENHGIPLSKLINQ